MIYMFLLRENKKIYIWNSLISPNAFLFDVRHFFKDSRYIQQVADNYKDIVLPLIDYIELKSDNPNKMWTGSQGGTCGQVTPVPSAGATGQAPVPSAGHVPVFLWGATPGGSVKAWIVN